MASLKRHQKAKVYFHASPQASRIQYCIRLVAMITNIASQEEVLLALSKSGFYAWDDSFIGRRVEGLEQQNFPYFTEYGLDFCADFAFDSVCVQQALCYLGS